MLWDILIQAKLVHLNSLHRRQACQPHVKI
jgi:hypothetical protein